MLVRFVASCKFTHEMVPMPYYLLPQVSRERFNALQNGLQGLEKKAEHRLNAMWSGQRESVAALARRWQRSRLRSSLTKAITSTRKEALDRASRVQTAAVSALGLASRARVEQLAAAVRRLAAKAQREHRAS